MFNPLLAAAAAVVLCASVSALAGAQSAAPRPPDIQEAQPPTPSAYRSAFEGYQPYTDETTGDWKAINATTAAVGGWRVYAKEARQPQTPDASAESGKSGSPPAASAKP